MGVESITLEYFGYPGIVAGVHNGLRNGDRVEFVDHNGQPHPLYTRVRILGFALNGLYCWCLVPCEGQRYLFLAFSVRGKFVFDNQQYTLIKKE